MRIKLNDTILESDNELVVEQWKKAGYEDLAVKKAASPDSAENDKRRGRKAAQE